MSRSSGNLLIVEDDQEWCDIYTRAAVRQNFQTIKIAKDLKEARSYIDDMRFAVAFVDIGLNVRDDQNVDGIQVMEKIRGSGDQTSIVVVTGRSGQDVLPITRDVIFKYQVHNIMRKADIELSEIRELLRTGLEAFEQGTAKSEESPQEALRGSLPAWSWDEQMLRATGARSGIQSVYGFLRDLLSDYLPLVPPRGGAALDVDEETGLAHGSYWSRAIGSPIAICYGHDDVVSAQIERAASDGLVMGLYHVDSLLKETASSGIHGAVFTLTGVAREDFGAE